MQKILVTGSVGFIGSALTFKLLDLGYEVIGLDNHNDYYDVSLKEDRLKRYISHKNYHHHQADLENLSFVSELFTKYQFDIVINLAAQAGVEYSIKNPQEYINSNITGFLNILECSYKSKIKHLIYASSSSVYGLNNNIPFSENDNVDHPVSLYAASKKTNELMAHVYSHMYSLPTTGLRFFTVYGPWDRPDMALQKFTRQILSGKKIQLYNYGNHIRDFTYIDDIVSGVLSILDFPPSTKQEYNLDQLTPSNSSAPWRIYNIGNNKPIKLEQYIDLLEVELGKKAEKELLPIKAFDMVSTYANIDKISDKFSYKPKVSVEEGIKKFVNWYLEYHKIKK